MSATKLLCIALLACVAVQSVFAIDATLCPSTSINTCNTLCDAGRNPVLCGDGNIACNPNNAGNEDTCCGCRGNACTSCDSGAFCLRSPDAASGWECSRFRLDAAQNQPSLYRLQGLKCALATNDVVLASTYAGAVTEYETSASNCLNSKFTANDGKSNDENLRFDCPAPESYKRVCSENKGTMCSVKGFMSNWRSFPAGALVANFTTQVCVPNECRDLSNEPRLNSYFNIAGGAFCTNGSSQGNYLCETTLECVPAPASPISADSQLQKNNEYNAGVIALLVIIVICIIVGLVLLFVLKK